MNNQNRHEFEGQEGPLFATPSNPNGTPAGENEVINVTLLELVKAVTEVSENESEVIATVAHMLESGSVSLTGFMPEEPRQLAAI